MSEPNENTFQQVLNMNNEEEKKESDAQLEIFDENILEKIVGIMIPFTFDY